MNKKNILFTLSICLLTCCFNAHTMDKKQNNNGLNEFHEQAKKTCVNIDKQTAIVKETTRTVENCIATVERTIARLEQQSSFAKASDSAKATSDTTADKQNKNS